eukprot:ctg_2995.g403
MERYRLPGAYLQVRCSEAQVNKRVALYSNRAGDEAYTNDDEDRRSFVVCVPAAQCPLRVYDPQMYHTAVCASRVTFPDGVHGKLYYRGYDVEELVASAAGASFEEVAFLLINGELPDAAALAQWRELLLSHTFLHEDILAQLRTIRHDAHPMGSLISAVSALSTFHPEANPALRGASLYAESEEARNKQVYRLLGKVATIAACVWRAKIGRSFVPPCTVYGEGDTSERNAVSYVGNFLRMLDGFVPHAALVSIVERAWIVLADDGLNCATGALRHVASSGADPYVCVGTAMAAMYGERISGVGKAVIRMLEELHAHVQHARLPSAEAERDCIAAYVDARYKRPRRRLQGFGHVNYKQYDPRARVLKQLCLEAGGAGRCVVCGAASVAQRGPVLAAAAAPCGFAAGVLCGVRGGAAHRGVGGALAGGAGRRGYANISAATDLRRRVGAGICGDGGASRGGGRGPDRSVAGQSVGKRESEGDAGGESGALQNGAVGFGLSTEKHVGRAKRGGPAFLLPTS